MQIRTCLILLFSLVLSSCEDLIVEGSVKTSSKLSNELQNSPEFFVLDNDTLRIQSYLWRDFMPIAEKNGSPLYSVVKFLGQDSLTNLSNIIMKTQYVINGNKIWIADYSDEDRNENLIIEHLKNGPKWGPDINVSVVAEFENLQTKGTYRMLERDVAINKVW